MKLKKVDTLVKFVKKDQLATFIKACLLASSPNSNNMFYDTNIVVEDNGNITIFDMKGKIKEWIDGEV